MMLAKKIALGFGIAIVFPMMIHHGVSIFSPKPKWRDYQVENYHARHKRATPAEQEKLESEKKQLEEQRKKDKERFQKHLFSVAVPLGIIAIIIGAYFPLKAMGAGLMFGGIFSACDGYFNYWHELGDILKFSSSLCAFIVLIIVGYKKLEKKT